MVRSRMKPERPSGQSGPDGPRALHRFAAEAWRRAEAGELPAEALYPGDAQWCGLYDRMHHHTPEERQRRARLA